MFLYSISYRRAKKNEGEVKKKELEDTVDLIWAIVGKCNVTYDSLYRLSVSDLVKIQDGKNNEIKEHWEMSRDIAFWSFRGHAKKGNSLKKTDIIRFPWEKLEEMSKEKIGMIQANASKLRDLMKNGKVKFKA